MPTPSHCPTSSKISRAAGSPSCAAAVTSGPVMAEHLSAGTVEDGVRDRRVGRGELTRFADSTTLPDAYCSQQPAVAALAAASPRHHLHVAELPRHAVAAALQHAVEQDRAAEAGAEVDADRMRLDARGTEAPLCPEGGVRVVLHHDREAQPTTDRLAQRLVAPGQVGRRARSPGWRR